MLTNRLAHDPRSHLRARLAGGSQHWAQWLGWGADQELQAATVDAVHLNTYVAAKVGGSKRAKPFPAHPRPTPADAPAASTGLGLPTAPTLAAFPAAALTAMVEAASDLPALSTPPSLPVEVSPESTSAAT